MQFFIGLMLFWWLMFMPLIALCVFNDAIQEWIVAKTDEIKERTIKLRKENQNEFIHN